MQYERSRPVGTLSLTETRREEPTTRRGTTPEEEITWRSHAHLEMTCSELTTVRTSNAATLEGPCPRREQVLIQGVRRTTWRHDEDSSDPSVRDICCYDTHTSTHILQTLLPEEEKPRLHTVRDALGTIGWTSLRPRVKSNVATLDHLEQPLEGPPIC
jgi:hypothetical protein